MWSLLVLALFIDVMKALDTVNHVISLETVLFGVGSTVKTLTVLELFIDVMKAFDSVYYVKLLKESVSALVGSSVLSLIVIALFVDVTKAFDSVHHVLHVKKSCFSWSGFQCVELERVSDDVMVLRVGKITFSPEDACSHNLYFSNIKPVLITGKIHLFL